MDATPARMGERIVPTTFSSALVPVAMASVTAAQMATTAGCEMVIANGQSPEVLYDVAAGKRVGTRFLAKRDEA